MLVSVLSLIFISQVVRHGAMLKPLNWFDARGLVGMKTGKQCASEVDYGENGPVEYLDLEDEEK